MNAIEEAIQTIDEQIEELQNRKNFLLNLNIDKAPNEKEWHEICETDLRYSNSLADILLVIFPDAKNIKVGSNYVIFTLYDFTCYIPTYRGLGIEVDTTWYKYISQPNIKDFVYGRLQILSRYVNAKNWNEKSKIIIGRNYVIWYRFILWWFYYRWKHNQYINEYNKLMDVALSKYDEQLQKYDIYSKELYEISNKFKNKLLPELTKFSTNIRIYQKTTFGSKSTRAIESIIAQYKKENNL